MPVDDEGNNKYVFPIAAAREKATSELKPLEFNQLELDKLDDEIMALEDEEDIPLLDLKVDFLATQSKPRAIKVTVERIIRLGPTPECGGCNLGQTRHTNKCHEVCRKMNTNRRSARFSRNTPLKVRRPVHPRFNVSCVN